MLFGLYFYNQKNGDQEEGESVVREYAIDGVVVRSEMDEILAEEAVNFVKDAMKEELLPQGIELSRVDAAEEEIAYFGTWTKGAASYSFLFVATKDGNSKYSRIWTLLEDKEITVNDYSLAEEVFTEELTSLITPACEEIDVVGVEVTRCGGVAETETGNLLGVTIQAPVFIEETGEETTTVTACYVPAKGKPFYGHEYCI